MKGISAIIATILLLLVAIAIIGFAFTFYQSMFGKSSNATSAQLSTITNQLSQSFRIENLDEGSASLPVRLSLISTGTSALNTNNIAVYINGTLSTATGGWSTSGNRVIWTATTNGACATGTVFKLTGPSNSETVTC